MKKFFSPEVKIALVAVLAIIVLFFGLQFLKGLSLFSNSTHYQMKFNDISGVTPTTPIFANGVKVGTVRDINYDYNNPNNPILVDVNIEKDMKLPIDTHADILSDIMGNTKVNLILGKSKEILAENGFINGQINDGSLGQMKTILPSIEKMLPKIDSILANVNNLLADPAMKGTLHNFDKISSELTISAKQLNLIMAKVNTDLPVLSSKANNLLINANNVMANANNGISEAQEVMKGAGGVVRNLRNQLDGIDISVTMAKINTILEDINTFTTNIKNNKGSLGLLINDPTLYYNLNSTMKSADSLLINFKRYPKRYIHFSVFGSKNK